MQMMIKRRQEIIRKLGAEIITENGELIIESDGFPLNINQSPLMVNCGESGLGIRMFTPIIALSDKEIIITGEGSLFNRPMKFFDEFFPKLEVSIQSNHGKAPIENKRTTATKKY